MRVTIDDKLGRVIVSDGFFTQLDKTSDILEEQGGKRIDHTQYVHDFIKKGLNYAIIRKSDIKGLKK